MPSPQKRLFLVCLAVTSARLKHSFRQVANASWAVASLDLRLRASSSALLLSAAWTCRQFSRSSLRPLVSSSNFCLSLRRSKFSALKLATCLSCSVLTESIALSFSDSWRIKSCSMPGKNVQLFQFFIRAGSDRGLLQGPFHDYHKTVHCNGGLQIPSLNYKAFSNKKLAEKRLGATQSQY